MIRAALACLVLLAGCTEPRSKRCQDVCAREAECRDSVESSDNFDEGECLDVCSALERDARAEEGVARHADCVRNADSCEQVIACP
jgi:hypothetical protein